MISHRGSMRSLLAALTALSGAACESAVASMDTDGPPTPASLRIVPSRVHALQGTDLTLRAMVLDASGTPIPEFTWELTPDSSSLMPVKLLEGDITWSAESATGSGNSGVSLEPDGRTVAVKIADTDDGARAGANGSGAVAGIRIKANYKTLTGTASLQVIRDSAALVEDRIAAEHLEGTRPAFAFVDGATGGCAVGARELRVAFVELGLADSLTTGCPESRVIAFVAGRRAGVQMPDWTDKPDLLELGNDGPKLPDPVEIRLALWLALNDTVQASTYALVEARLAATLYSLNTAGVQVTVVGDSAGLLQPTGTVVDLDACDPALTATLFPGVSGKSVPDFDDSSLIHVIYVDDLYGTAMARACPPQWRVTPAGDPVSGLILVSSEGVSLVDILAHELGHVLTLSHIEDVDGFSSTNIMKGFVGMKSPPRTHLTMGQLFRALLEDDSWINHAGLTDWRWRGLTKSCAFEPCPELAADM